ncbi:MAG: LytR C-terminal domain-containing protein [Gemmatimonadaceae bacterium]
MKGRSLAILGLVIVILAIASAMASRMVSGTVFGLGPTGNAPPGVRIRVQVLNATTTRGLARRATDLLRERGFDVVEVGTSRERSDSTVVLDRSNHPDWARRVAVALGGAQVLARPDTSRYLDITVLLGATWRPPAQPFHP